MALNQAQIACLTFLTVRDNSFNNRLPEAGGGVGGQPLIKCAHRCGFSEIITIRLHFLSLEAIESKYQCQLGNEMSPSSWKLD